MLLFLLFYSHSHTTTAAEREKNRRCCAGRARKREKKTENRFGEIFLLPMSSYYIMAVLLAPCGWIRRKRKRPTQSTARRALFSHKKQFNLSCQRKTQHKRHRAAGNKHSGRGACDGTLFIRAPHRFICKRKWPSMLILLCFRAFPALFDCLRLLQQRLPETPMQI